MPNDITTLKEYLKEWTDLETAGYDLGYCLGLLTEDMDYRDAKFLFWSSNPVGDTLIGFLDELVKLGVLEFKDEDDHLYKWNEKFEITAE